jgi:hypothetical protein
MSNGQKGQSRPWRLELRREDERNGGWRPWRVHATFKEFDRADAVGRVNVDEWGRMGYRYEYRVVARSRP